jgi:hypothetical protein
LFFVLSLLIADRRALTAFFVLSLAESWSVAEIPPEGAGVFPAQRD